MSNIFQPDYHFNNIYEISPEYLKGKKISCVLLDIDNTLVPYSVKTPDDKVLGWLKKLKDNGLSVVILSNSIERRALEFSKGIPQDVAEALGLITIGKAGKPLARGFKRAEEQLGFKKSEMCIIGDQIFTDILGGNLYGITSILVNPINRQDEEFFIKTKRLAEKPVLSIHRRKYREKGGSKVGLLGVIGYPIEHSLSPEIHNTICDITGYNFYYSKFKVKPENLKEEFMKFKETGFKGLNVTIPHKGEIFKFIDVADEESEEIGAVNTIIFRNGISYGYNTDVTGFIKSLERDIGFNINEKSVLILGAGGAAKGIAYSCKKFGASKIDFVNRTYEKARALAGKFGGNVLTEDEHFSDRIKEYDLIVNTTSAGMKPQEDIFPVASEFTFRQGQVCFDAIYDPYKTKLLQKAEKEGAAVINGYGMLFWQAVESFNKWLGAQQLKELTEDEISTVRKVLKERGIEK